MGVYIEGMEMPTSCSNCLLAKLSPTGESLICNYTLSTVPWDGKPFDCPLAPVPPHGRLIDADALRAKQQEDADLFQGSTAYGDKCRRDEAMNAVANIVNAPTIIPAEEGE